MASAICRGVAFSVWVWAAATGKSFVLGRKRRAAPLYRAAPAGSIRNLEETMADATTAARDRIDRALALLEGKVLDLKSRPASPPGLADDDLFAIPAAGASVDPARLAELEAAGREASAALAAAAAAIRDVLAEDTHEPDRAA
jgi:hypothetical protein